MKGLSGRESRPEALFDNQDKFSANNLVENRGLAVLEHARKDVCARMCSAVSHEEVRKRGTNLPTHR